MKNWLKNTLIAGGILAGSLKGFSQSSQDSNFSKYLSDSSNWKTYEVHEGTKQPEYCSKNSIKQINLPSYKESQKKLGIKNIGELKNLGHGYVTSKGEFDLNGGKNYNDLRMIHALKEGTMQLDYNGKRGIGKGNFYGDPSEKTLEEVDNIERDYIITSEEISSVLNKEKEKVFLDYASKTLNVPKDSIIDIGKGYVTSKNLENLLKATGNVYKKLSGESLDKLYNHMSEEDAVLTEEEILRVSEIMNDYIGRE